jgi:hypothetical protein
MKTTTLILSLVLIAKLSVAQNFKRNSIAFQINNENKNIKNWLIPSDNFTEQSSPKKEQNKLRLVSKTGLIYFTKLNEVDFDHYLSEIKKEKSIVDEELELRIHGKTDYSTRNNN